jgi:hypothetical protein
MFVTSLPDPEGEPEPSLVPAAAPEEVESAVINGRLVKCTCHLPPVGVEPSPQVVGPAPFLSTQTVSTYVPLKKKTLPESDQWIRQLRNFPGIGAQKAKAIATQFSSLANLFAYLQKEPPLSAQSFLASLPLSGKGNRTLGEKSAQLLYNKIMKT